MSERISRHVKSTGGGGGGGEANTASNYGVGGVGLYHSKSGVALRFKNINAGSSKVTVTDDPTNREVDIDIDPSQIDVNDLQNVDSLSADYLAGVSNTGQLQSQPGFQIDTNWGGLNVSRTVAAAGLGGASIHNWYTEYNPAADASTDTFNNFNIQAQIDTGLGGFDLGDSGSALNLLNLGITHNGDSNTGYLNLIDGYLDIGDGTNTPTVKGFAASLIYANVDNGVTLDGAIQGYIFQPSFNSGVVTTSNVYFQGVTENANLLCDMNSVTSFNAATQVSGIRNNNNYTGFNLYPTITTLQGNASFTGVASGGTITNLGATSFIQGILVNQQLTTVAAANGYAGINVTPQITTNNSTNMNFISVNPVITNGSGEANGLNITMSQVGVSGATKAVNIVGKGGLSDIAIASDSGHHNMYYSFEVPISTGQFSGNIIGGQVNLGANRTVTGTDIIANNFAYTVDIGSGTTSYTKSIFGIASVGFVGQFTGSASGGVDDASMLLAGYAAAHTAGNITNLYNVQALAIPTGAGGTITNSIGYRYDLPFGPVATDHWGVMVDYADAHNYFAGQLVVGSANKKTANTSVGIELDSTTKAVLVSRMTTTERNALTALDGMIIYNTTAGKFQGYEAGAWVNLI